MKVPKYRLSIRKEVWSEKDRRWHVVEAHGTYYPLKGVRYVRLVSDKALIEFSTIERGRS